MSKKDSGIDVHDVKLEEWIVDGIVSGSIKTTHIIKDVLEESDIISLDEKIVSILANVIAKSMWLSLAREFKKRGNNNEETNKT